MTLNVKRLNGSLNRGIFLTSLLQRIQKHAVKFFLNDAQKLHEKYEAVDKHCRTTHTAKCERASTHMYRLYAP